MPWTHFKYPALYQPSGLNRCNKYWYFKGAFLLAYCRHICIQIRLPNFKGGKKNGERAVYSDLKEALLSNLLLKHLYDSTETETSRNMCQKENQFLQGQKRSPLAELKIFFYALKRRTEASICVVIGLLRWKFCSLWKPVANLLCQKQKCHFNQGKDTSTSNQVISYFKGTKERSSEQCVHAYITHISFFEGCQSTQNCNTFKNMMCWLINQSHQLVYQY